MLKYLNKCQVGLVRAAQAAGVSVHPPPPSPRSPGRGSAGWERGCRGGRFALARGVSLSAGTTSAGAEGEAAAAGRRAAAFPSLPRGGSSCLPTASELGEERSRGRAGGIRALAEDDTRR